MGGWNWGTHKIFSRSQKGSISGLLLKTGNGTVSREREQIEWRETDISVSYFWFCWSQMAGNGYIRFFWFLLVPNGGKTEISVSHFWFLLAKSGPHFLCFSVQRWRENGYIRWVIRRKHDVYQKTRRNLYIKRRCQHPISSVKENIAKTYLKKGPAVGVKSQKRIYPSPAAKGLRGLWTLNWARKRSTIFRGLQGHPPKMAIFGGSPLGPPKNFRFFFAQPNFFWLKRLRIG